MTNSTRADTIARHLNATTLCEADKRLLHLAFLECLGGAAVAGKANCPTATAPRFAPVAPSTSHEWIVVGGVSACRQCGAARMANEKRGCPRQTVSTPSPPKPAGWVVRGTDGAVRLHTYDPDGDFDDRSKPHVFTVRAEAEVDAEHWRHTIGRRYPVVVLPVDAAGNVIEALPGVAWEAARAGEEVERLRADMERLTRERDELRNTQATILETANDLTRERDAVRTELATIEDEAERLRADLDAALTERADLRIALRAVEAERDRLAVAEEALSYEARTQREHADQLTADVTDLRHVLRDIATTIGSEVRHWAPTETLCAVADDVRAAVERLAAERDALAAEVQRSREQKPVRWGVRMPNGTLLFNGGNMLMWASEANAQADAALVGGTVAPLYLAPVVRDHSGVIAQCEEALAALDTPHRMADVDAAVGHITAALAALRGAP